MLRPLPLVSMRQKHHKPGEEAPFRLTRRDELVHDDLSAVRKITKLCLPKHQRLRIVAREAILEAKHCGFRKQGVVHLKSSLFFAQVSQRNIANFRLGIDHHSMSLVERSTLRVLSSQTHRSPLFQQRRKRDKLCHSVVEEARSRSHLDSLLEELLDLGMNMEAARKSRHTGDKLGNAPRWQASWNIVFRLQFAALVSVPISGKLSEVWLMVGLRRCLLVVEQRLLHLLHLGRWIDPNALCIQLIKRRTALDNGIAARRG